MDRIVKLNQELADLRAQATVMNSEINSSPTPSIRKARVAQYMELGNRIAALRSEKLKAEAERLAERTFEKAPAADKHDIPFVKIATLYFPTEQRVQYYATTDGVVELMLMLREVFEDEAPAITAFFSVPASQVEKIPQEWYNLELVADDEKEDTSNPG